MYTKRSRREKEITESGKDARARGEQKEEREMRTEREELEVPSSFLSPLPFSFAHSALSAVGVIRESFLRLVRREQ